MVGSAVQDDGLLGYVCRASARSRAPPSPSRADSTCDFAVGAFLLAGTELLKLTT